LGKAPIGLQITHSHEVYIVTYRSAWPDREVSIVSVLVVGFGHGRADSNE
jgi:hypothetical protein